MLRVGLCECLRYHRNQLLPLKIWLAGNLGGLGRISRLTVDLLAGGEGIY